MNERWPNHWCWQLILTVASMIVLMVLAVVVTDAVAGHAVAAESQIDWKAQLAKVEDSAGRNDVAQAMHFWPEAYAAALRSRHWEGLIAVGDVYRRLGDLGGFQKAAAAKARQTYLAALFRARQEGSVEGVLRAAEAFAELGDVEVVEHCLKIARTLAAQAHDAPGAERVRAFAERWEARKLEVGRHESLRREGNAQ